MKKRGYYGMGEEDFYTFSRVGNTIIFQSGDGVLTDAVDDYISMLTDAERYRSGINKIVMIEEDEANDETSRTD